jgi:hypothetical protein
MNKSYYNTPILRNALNEYENIKEKKVNRSKETIKRAENMRKIEMRREKQELNEKWADELYH